MRLFCFLLLFSLPEIYAQSLPTFLEEHAIEVEVNSIDENIRHFLHPKQKKQQHIWNEGRLINVDGQEFSQLQLKFNTFTNMLFLRNKAKIYSISRAAIAEFSIRGEQKEKRFIKGFGQMNLFQIKAHIKCKSNELLSYLNAYSHLSELDVRTCEIKAQGIDRSEIQIKFIAPHRKKAEELVRFLEQHPDQIFTQLISNGSPTNEKTFYEVLYEGKDFYFLKHNQRRISSHDSNALAKHSSTISFDDSKYFFSNHSLELKEVRFNRKSVKEALSFAGKPTSRKIPGIPNARQMIRYLNGQK